MNVRKKLAGTSSNCSSFPFGGDSESCQIYRIPCRTQDRPARLSPGSKLLELDLGRFAQPVHDCRRNVAFSVVDTFNDDCIHILAIQFPQC